MVNYIANECNIRYTATQLKFNDTIRSITGHHVASRRCDTLFEPNRAITHCSVQFPGMLTRPGKSEAEAEAERKLWGCGNRGRISYKSTVL